MRKTIIWLRNSQVSKLVAGKFVNSSFVKSFDVILTRFLKWTDATETQEEKLLSLRSEMNREIGVLNRANFTTDQRSRYIQTLNEKYGEYLPRLI